MPGRFLLTFAALLWICDLTLLAQAGKDPKPKDPKPKDNPGTKWSPPDELAESLNLTSLSLAKATTEGNALQVIIPRVLPSTRTDEVQVQQCRLEQRTRNVQNSEGQMQEQTYSVSVPYVETKTMTRTVMKVALKQRLTIPANELRGWKLNGENLSSSELLERASSPVHFLIHHSLVPYKGIDPYYAQAMNPDTPVIFIGNDFTKKYADESSPKPSDSPPAKKMGNSSPEPTPIPSPPEPTPIPSP